MAEPWFGAGEGAAGPEPAVLPGLWRELRLTLRGTPKSESSNARIVRARGNSFQECKFRRFREDRTRGRPWACESSLSRAPPRNRSQGVQGRRKDENRESEGQAGQVTLRWHRRSGLAIRSVLIDLCSLRGYLRAPKSRVASPPSNSSHEFSNHWRPGD